MNDSDNAQVLIVLAQGCEELEAVTVIDLMRRAGITVTVAGLDSNPIKASRGVRIIPDRSLDSALVQDYEMIVLPGGLPGADHLAADSRLRDRLRSMHEAGRWCAAICAAPRVLHQCGILDGHRATAYPGILEQCGHDQISTAAVVRDGSVITSRGPGTAMDFALELIEVLAGRSCRDEVDSGLQRA